MAFAPTFERWNGFDHLNATDIVAGYTSGSIGGTVAGLRGEGQAISLPVDLLMVGLVAGNTEIIAHVRLRYDQDDAYFLKIYTATASGPYLQITSGTITAHRSDGALIGTASGTWASGAKHTLSVAFTMSAVASGKVKVWVDSTAVLDLSSVQTVPTGLSTTAQGVFLNGFGIHDDQGLIYGAGGWVDADVPIKKWVRTGYANATATFNQFTTYGSGSTHVDRVNETIANGSTNGVEYTSADGSIEGFKMAAYPSNVGTPWAVQFEVNAAQNGGALVRSIRLQTRDGGGGHNQVGSFALSLTFAPYFKALRLNGAGSAWDASSFGATEFEVILTA